MASDTEMTEASPVDTLPQPNDGGRMHMSSLSSSSSISDAETERRGRSERPRMASRKPSASILVPRDHPEIEIEEEEFPPRRRPRNEPTTQFCRSGAFGQGGSTDPTGVSWKTKDVLGVLLLMYAISKISVANQMD